MELILRGESRKSAAEPALLNLFPPETEGMLTSSLRRGAVWITGTARFETGGRVSRAAVRARSGTGDEDYCVKESVYRAALPLLDQAPPWGSLTGIRPAKLAAALLETGEDAARVLRERYHVSSGRRTLALTCARQTLAERARLRDGDVALYLGSSSGEMVP